MMAQWEDVYREVVIAFAKLQQSVSSTYGKMCLKRSSKRWQSRQDFRNGKIGAEVTVKINVVNETM
jgi:hypothetical protein